MTRGITRVEGKSLTRQAGKADADINTLMRRYTQGAAPQPLIFGDMTQIPKTLQGAFDLVSKATSAFSSLPSQVRFRFRNQPLALLSFLENPENKAEAIKLGLIPPEPPDPVEEAAERQVRIDEAVEAKKALRRSRTPTPGEPPKGA